MIKNITLIMILFLFLTGCKTTGQNSSSSASYQTATQSDFVVTDDAIYFEEVMLLSFDSDFKDGHINFDMFNPTGDMAEIRIKAVAIIDDYAKGIDFGIATLSDGRATFNIFEDNMSNYKITNFEMVFSSGIHTFIDIDVNEWLSIFEEETNKVNFEDNP
ncbi:MAG: hypothetical protein OCD02_00710 [Spirochaetaceae bacterium]